MAILFETHFRGQHYQVRSAGRTRRLYTDGVFHSQYNAAHIMTGSVWDLLFLPSQFYQPGELKRVLVLGVGGGSVIHMLQRFVKPTTIVAIELSTIHIELAKRFFDLEYPNLELVQADAAEWMANYSGEPFDLIIEDLFYAANNKPRRAIPGNSQWFEQLLRHLAMNGLLVMNFSNYWEWRESAYFQEKWIRMVFQSVYRFATPVFHNAVVGFLRKPSDVSELSSALKKEDLLNPTRSCCRLRYAVRKIALRI